jgi:hypothetical protein
MLWQQFEQIWLVDFEFLGRANWWSADEPGNPPDPICLVAHELLTGQTVRLQRHQFGHEPPYRTDAQSLFVAFYASAELGCHLALNWPQPVNVLDLYIEFRNRLGGRTPPAGFGLNGALAAHGLPGIDDKEEMRALVRRGGPWTLQERTDILDYCQSDTLSLAQLFPRMAGYIDLPRALLRGRYMWAAAWMEWVGIPVDVEALRLILANWEQIKLALIAEKDRESQVFEGTHFRLDRFAAYLERIGLLISWPRTEKGQLKTDIEAFEEMEDARPEVRDLKELKSAIDKLKLGSLAVGADGRNRTLLSAFASKTARNQPSNAKFVFLSDTWLRSVIKPERGWALAYLDWEQQEFGLAAALSGDANMIRAYLSGDCYLEFAKMAGAIPAHVNKSNYKTLGYEFVRNQYKQCVLAVQYGQGAAGLAGRTGLSVVEARELMQRHREQFHRFWQWSDRILDTATFRLELPTMYGWWLDTTDIYTPRHHTGREKKRGKNICSPRTIRNFLMQAGGSEMMRIAAIRAAELGIRVCCPVHDAFLVESRSEEIEQVIATTQDCMRLASRDVLQILELRTDAKVVRWPNRYADPRGNYVRQGPNGLERGMWNVIAELVGLQE